MPTIIPKTKNTTKWHLQHPNFVPVKNPYPERGGSNYPLKQIATIAELNKISNINDLQDKLYRYAAAVIEYAFRKRPLKEILPIAKEVYRIGPPQLIPGVTLLIHGSLADISNLEKLYSHIEQGKEMKQVEGNEKIVK